MRKKQGQEQEGRKQDARGSFARCQRVARKMPEASCKMQDARAKLQEARKHDARIELAVQEGRRKELSQFRKHVQEEGQLQEQASKLAK